jgi:CRP-like cAMP-binding protein
VQVVKEPDAEGEEQKVLAVLSAGHCFGEMSLLSSEVRSASMRCLGNTLVMRLDLEAFTRLTTMYPELEHEMRKVAAERAAFSASKETRKKLSTRRVMSSSSAEASPSGATSARRVSVARDQSSTSVRPAEAMSHEDATALVEQADGLDRQLEQALDAQDFEATRRLTTELEALSPTRKIASAVVEKAAANGR